MDLLYAKEGPIAIFTMNRPEKYNAISPEMMQLFEERLMEFMEDAEVHAGIVTGAGEKAFCSGADVLEWLPFVKARKNSPWRMPKTMLHGLHITKPLIAAVNGVALGGGGEIALACDIRIAAEDASFCWPEPKLGIIPRLGGTQRLPRLIGRAKAMEILLTTRRISSEEALRIGLVSRVTTKENLMENAREIAMKISSLAPLAVRCIKRLIMDGMELPLDAALELESEVGLRLYDTEDYIEGGLAFKEKRTPRFKGC